VLLGLNGQGLGQADDAVLAGSISGLVGVALNTDNAGDINNEAGLSGGHNAHGFTAAKKSTAEVDSQNGVEVLSGEILQRAETTDAGAVNKDVQRGDPDDPGKELADGGFVGNVSGNGRGLLAPGGDFPGKGVELVGGSSGENNVSTGLGQGLAIDRPIPRPAPVTKASLPAVGNWSTVTGSF